MVDLASLANKGFGMILTAAEVRILAEIAAERSVNEKQREANLHLLIRGFERWADEKLMEQFPTPESLIRKRSDWLLENYDKADQTSADAFATEPGRNSILQMLRGLNVADRFLDELADIIIAKFWRHNHAEKYNPLKAPWGHHVRHAVKTCVASYWDQRSRNPLEVFQTVDENGDTVSKSCVHYNQVRAASDDEMSFEPYQVHQSVDSPESAAILKEFLDDFKLFLKWEKSFRTTVIKPAKDICILLAPGTPEYPVAMETPLCVRAKGRNNFRVSVPGEEGENSFLVPTNLLKDFPPSGNEPPQKTYANPEYAEGSNEKRVERTPLDVYDLLDRGYQVDEIAKELNVGPSTAHNWVRHLQDLFTTYWGMSEWIPHDLKKLSRPAYKCSSCSKIDEFEDETECQKCGTEFKPEDYAIHLDIFPWKPVRGTAGIQERAERYRKPAIAESCSM
jgi:hypothetical protein